MRPEIIDALVAAGATAEQLAAAMKAEHKLEEERKAERRAKAAERQRRFRARNALSREHDVTNANERVTTQTPPHPPLPSSPNPTNQPPLYPPISTEPDGSVSAKSRKSDFEAEFETWWRETPRKTGKGQARRAYRSARRKTTAAVLLAGIQRHAAEMSDRDTEFIPHPATWLNGERWLDERPKQALIDLEQLRVWAGEA